MTTTKTSEFKDTEIGEIPSDWAVRPLGEIANIEAGGNAPQGEQYFSNGDSPFVRVQHFNGDKKYINRWDLINNDALLKYRLKLFPAESVLFPKSGASINLEKRAKLPCSAYVVGHLAVANPRENSCDSDFLYYLLRYIRLGADSNGTTLPFLNISFINLKKVPVPGKQEQERIAAVLSKVQKAVEDQDKIVADLCELKSATTAKFFREGLRGEPLKQTEIGELPKSWAVKRLSDVASLQGGFAFKSSDYKESGIRLFKIANVSFGKTIWDDMSFLPSTYLEAYRDYALKSGDIVMAMTRPIVSGGIKIAITSENDAPCLLNQRVGRFLLKENINPNYFYCFLFSEYFLRHIVVGADGAQQPNISSKKIEEALIPYPSLEEQVEIASAIQAISKSYDCNVEKLKEFKALFSSTLNQLMTGKVRVS